MKSKETSRHPIERVKEAVEEISAERDMSFEEVIDEAFEAGMGDNFGVNTIAKRANVNHPKTMICLALLESDRHINVNTLEVVEPEKRDRTKIVYSNSSTREDVVDKLVGDIRKGCRLSEQVEIAQRLLSHPEIREPPEMVKELAEAISISLKGFADWDVEGAWEMVRDKLWVKLGDSEK